MGQKMDKDSTATNKVLRLFRLLMSSDKQWYLPELAEKLNCSPQTVLRLTEAIEHEMGESLQTGKEGKYRWYRLMPKSWPDRLPWAKNELRLLEICQDLTEPFLINSSLEMAERDLQKLALLLSDEGSASQLHKQYVFCDKGYIDYQPYTTTMEQMSRAISDKVVLDLEFTSLQQKKTVHYLWAPQVISAMNGALYVFGCELKPDLSVKERRFVAIHRITNLVWRDEHFSLPTTEIDYDRMVLPWDKLRTYVIRFKPGKAAEYVRERTWASSEHKRDLDDGGLEIEITTNNGTDIHNWVQRFAPDAKLVSEQEAEFQAHVMTRGLIGIPPIGGMVGAIVGGVTGIFGSSQRARMEAAMLEQDPEAKQWHEFKQECDLYHGEL